MKIGPKIRRYVCVVGAVIFAGVLFVLSHPPVAGYYRSPLFAIMDGSAGYLHLHDGTIDIVNTGGTGTDTRMQFGTYRALGGSDIEIVFPSLQSAPEHVSVGWAGFYFSDAFAEGMPDGSRCGREFLPWRLHRLDEIK